MRTVRAVRKDLSKIDIKMRKLFLKRMKYSTEMADIKTSLNLPFEDKDREDYLKRKYAKDIVDYRKSYLTFLDTIFSLSKEEMNNTNKK